MTQCRVAGWFSQAGCLLLVLLLTAACSSPRTHVPDLATVYKEAAQSDIRNPAVVIHGVLGSRLVQRDTGMVVWGAFTNEAVDPKTTEGMRAIALPLEVPQTPRVGTMVDDVAATGPLDRFEIGVLFQVVAVEIYAGILRTLGVGGYLDEVTTGPDYNDQHFTCFSFFYDWRKDNVANAIELGRFLAEKRTEVEQGTRAKIDRLRSKGELAHAQALEAWLARGVKFDVVAHSMGGLVSRYYLRYGATDLPADGSHPEVTWAGAKDIDRLILIGTPNFGAVPSFERLLEGMKLSFVAPHYPAALIGTMPSVYQVLPRTRHGSLVDAAGNPTTIDLFDVEVWDQNRWGLMSDASAPSLAILLPEVSDPAEQRAIAKRYVAWCLKRAQAFTSALDQVPTTPPPAQLVLFASDTEPTLASTQIRQVDGRLVPNFNPSDGLMVPGDGTVPRYSALADERHNMAFHPHLESPIPWHHVTFIADDHVGLTNNPNFSNNLLFILLEQRPTTSTPP